MYYNLSFKCNIPMTVAFTVTISQILICLQNYECIFGWL